MEGCLRASDWGSAPEGSKSGVARQMAVSLRYSAAWRLSSISCSDLTAGNFGVSSTTTAFTGMMCVSLRESSIGTLFGGAVVSSFSFWGSVDGTFLGGGAILLSLGVCLDSRRSVEAFTKSGMMRTYFFGSACIA